MHGKKREDYKAKMRDPKTSKVLAQKAEQWYILIQELHGRRHHNKKSTDSTASDDNHNNHNNNNSHNHNNNDDDDDEQTLALLGKALLVNPDPMNLWNHRRELISKEMSVLGITTTTSSSSTDDATSISTTTTTSENNNNNNNNTTAETIVQRERALTNTALQRNPKAYGAWFHRKWILQTFRPHVHVLQQELGLTSQFLKLDERNFHCWNYRRFVVACLGNSWDGSWNTRNLNNNNNNNNKPPLMGQQVVLPSKKSSLTLTTSSTTTTTTTSTTSTTTIPAPLIASEFEFTSDKIHQNFSNFSAFHYRSQLLDLVMSSMQNDENENDNNDRDDYLNTMEERLDVEFQLVQDAVCTEPDDQTCWWYHAILLDTLLQIDKDAIQHSGSAAAADDDDDHNHDDDHGDLLVLRFRERLQEQADLFRELLEDSPNSKWVILGLFKVLKVLGQNNNNNKNNNNNNSIREPNDDENNTDNREERDVLLQKLQEIDPYRANRYEYLRAQQ